LLLRHCRSQTVLLPLYGSSDGCHMNRSAESTLCHTGWGSCLAARSGSGKWHATLPAGFKGVGNSCRRFLLNWIYPLLLLVVLCGCSGLTNWHDPSCIFSGRHIM
jgi:hypothetical protein